MIYVGFCLEIFDLFFFQPILPSSLVEYQRLRCRVAFHVLRFRAEIEEVANLMVARQVT